MNGSGSFGSWLKHRRKALDLTQAELADQVGCSVTALRKIEADERRPSKQIAERLGDALAIAPEERPTFIAFARRSTSASPPVLLPRVVDLPAHSLPIQPTSFIGRTEELSQIAQRLDNPA